MRKRRRRGRGQTVTVIGAGNIGAHLLPHLARDSAISSLKILDRDVYEEKNLASQDIVRSDVGKPKAKAQAARLRRINPRLEVTAIVDDVESVPIGLLRADVILACLDSRWTRQLVNQAAWRLGGIPWIDAGVEPSGWLARVSTYAPGHETACWECLFDDTDYALLEREYPCDGAAAIPTPTNAPSSLGALAAAMQAIECGKLLGGLTDRDGVAREVVIDAAHQKHFITPLRRNPRCRFDHEVWRLEATVPPDLTLDAAAKLGDSAGGTRPRLQVEGRAFLTRCACSRCGAVEAFVHLAAPARAQPPVSRACGGCGRPMAADLASLVEFLDTGTLPEAERQRTLGGIGLRAGDLFAVVGSPAAKYYEIDASLAKPARARGKRER